MAFTLETLKQNIKKLKDSTNKSSPGEWPTCVFLPEGTHKGRFITDPNGDLFERYPSFGYFAKGIRDPRSVHKEDLPAGFDADNCDLIKMSKILIEDYKKFKYGSSWNFITYFYLMDTDSKSDNWQPGNLYCIIAKTKFYKAFNDFMTTMSEDNMEILFEILNPKLSSNGWVAINVTGGAQGSASIMYMPHKCEAIVPQTKEMTDDQWLGEIGKLGYKPLTDSYIRPGFNQEKYDNLCKQYASALDELSGNAKSDPESSKDDKKEDKEAVEDKKEVKKEEEKKEVKTVEEASTTSVPPVDQKEDVFAKWRTKK